MSNTRCHSIAAAIKGIFIVFLVCNVTTAAASPNYSLTSLFRLQLVLNLLPCIRDEGLSEPGGLIENYDLEVPTLGSNPESSG